MKARITSLFILFLISILLLFSCSFEEEYTVTFSVDGTDHAVTVKRGEIPEFSGNTYKLPEGKVGYTFVGWDKELTAASSDTVYTAVYEERDRYEYTVVFRYNISDVASRKVKEGDTPTLPTVDPVTLTERNIFTFKNEWSLPVCPITEEFFNENKDGKALIYTALYDSEERYYDISFKIGDRIVQTEKLKYGEFPEYKGDQIVLPDGYNYYLWDIEQVDSDKVYELRMTHYDIKQLDKAFFTNNLTFVPSGNDNAGGVMASANALIYLILEVRDAPSLKYADDYSGKVIQSLRSMVSDQGEAPYFDLEPYWCYTPLTAAIALAKDTPRIWNRLSSTDRLKYDIIMRSFAYVLTLGTADGNNYKTGPGLCGNYGKNWNPNYRLSSVTPMLFIADYFGGADELNKILLNFDYETAIADFASYNCFERAYERWTTKITDENGEPLIDPATGSPYPDASYFMENGGNAYIFTQNERLGYDGIADGGSGVGVRTEYLYNGYTLDQVDEIMRELLTYNYSGGNVFSNSASLGDKGVYPSTALDPLLVGTSKAYILDGTLSPVEGELGMMLEFNSSDGGSVINGKNSAEYNGDNIRSSCSYTLHDFLMVCSSLATLEALEKYDIHSTDNEDVLTLVWVGNTDFVYKLERGYMSYSLGSGYESHEGDVSDGYSLWKCWWNNRYGDVTIDELPSMTAPFNNIIFSESFEHASVDVSDINKTIEGITYGTNGKFGASFVTEHDGGNTFITATSEGLKDWDGTGEEPRTDMLLNVYSEGGLYSAMGKYTSFTFSIDLAKKDGVLAPSCAIRLRALKDIVNLITINTNGDVFVGDADNTKIKIGELSTELKNISVTVDFADGSIKASFDGGEVVNATLPLPENVAASTPMEWFTMLNSYIFNWYFNSNRTTETRVIMADNIKLTVNRPVEE